MALPRGKPRWILASLVLELGRAVPDRRLVEQVWGPPGASSAALRSATSRLRGWLAEAGLGEDVSIEYTGTAYVMYARRTVLDAARATLLLREPQHGPRRFEDLVEAAQLWREPALADAPPGLRHHPVTAELDQMRSRCVVELGELAARLGRSAPVLGLLRRAARDAPYDEPVQAAFVTAAHQCGLRMEAARHYDMVCRYLASDLGVRPSPALLGAGRALHGEEPGGREPAGRRPSPARPRRPLTAQATVRGPAPHRHS
ncbi:AfsR/SARP family transcriptional regulator [Actinacidiphila sp. ITFR-21]|uniref:AfsR/SARP family transcriptional regulator n=1 Tax=Actinacidiphila sp. ITFR-21 TaxID=3075199 RepID=UPI00288BB873|nr:BTAD domain-containing putative transcriptional regulator [Streptomyces sp. ITFR-21]WNI15076.1 BTAD domain-containing putative transcriptional regulator [Streptomyces sp. ITFR-21]